MLYGNVFNCCPILLVLLLSCLLSSYIVSGGPLSTFGDRAARVDCGNELTDEDVLVVEKNFEQDIANFSQVIGVALVALEIDVYFHVVAANATAQGGWISNSQIDAQIEVLNQDYAEAGVNWRHAGTTRIISRQWFEGITPDNPKSDVLMKTIFRKGAPNALNVFTVEFPDSTLLGYSSFPWNFRNQPNQDGIVLRHSSLPGGSTINHNLGRTLTHEAGHWLGLYHTFQGGCTGQGDLVDDTAAVRRANFGCPTLRDSCAGGGVDLIHNFMDYTDDDCKTGFTPGQISRLQTAIQLYRNYPAV